MCIRHAGGAWIMSGTVPTLIYYGLSVISPQLFLPIAFLGTLHNWASCAGSWGAAGTIGIAFMGIAAALDIPLGMAAPSSRARTSADRVPADRQAVLLRSACRQ